MKKIFLIFLLMLIASGNQCNKKIEEKKNTVKAEKAVGFKRDPELKIESLEPVKINGIDQWILVRGKDISKPVLLHLHGGPGDPTIPYAHVLYNKLLDKVIVAHWDQRGIGLSLSENVPIETMNMNQFIEDANKVTEYLKNKFHKDKIYLVGHSWGSMLGISVVQKYPEDYYAYVGIGQVVSEKLSNQYSEKWLKKKFTDNGISLKGMDYPGLRYGYIFKYGGYLHKQIDILKIRNSSPYISYYDYKSYPVGVNKNAYTTALMVNSMTNFDLMKNVKELKVPAYFFCGKYDYATPAKPVENYYKMLKAPHKEIVWFEESAHFMNFEEPEKFQNAIMKIIKKFSGD